MAVVRGLVMFTQHGFRPKVVVADEADGARQGRVLVGRWSVNRVLGVANELSVSARVPEWQVDSRIVSHFPNEVEALLNLWDERPTGEETARQNGLSHGSLKSSSYHVRLPPRAVDRQVNQLPCPVLVHMLERKTTSSGD